MAPKRQLPPRNEESPERRPSTRARKGTRTGDDLASQVAVAGPSQERQKTRSKINIVSKPSAIPDSSASKTKNRPRIVLKTPTPAPATAPTVFEDPEDPESGERSVTASGPEPDPTPQKKPQKTKQPKTKRPAAPESEPEPEDSVMAPAKSVRISLRADTSFIRPADWAQPKPKPETLKRQEYKDITVEEGWNLPRTERVLKGSLFAYDLLTKLKTLQKMVHTSALEAVKALDSRDRLFSGVLIGVDVKAGRLTGRGEATQYQAPADINHGYKMGDIQVDDLLELMLQVPEDRYIRISHKYRINIAETTVNLPSSAPRPASTVRQFDFGTPAPSPGLDRVLDRARSSATQARSDAGTELFYGQFNPPGVQAASSSAAPSTAKRPRASATNSMIDDLNEKRYSDSLWNLYDELAKSLKCEDPKCLNTRKGTPFSYCYPDPSTSKHLSVPASDINRWKVAIVKGDATSSNPPNQLYRKWTEGQIREESKLASDSGCWEDDRGPRRSSGRGASGGITTQNITNINLGQLADPGALATLQNSTAQNPPNRSNPDLPTLPPPAPRNEGHSRAPFEIPIRSSSPPPIVGEALLDFLDAFKRQHFAGNPEASTGIDNIRRIASLGHWEFSDLEAQRPVWFTRQGLSPVWIPILRTEAKRVDFVGKSAGETGTQPPRQPESVDRDLSIPSIEEGKHGLFLTDPLRKSSI
jgi:hypothetical protein